MTILITGSTGKTARRVALQLQGKHPILIAGRSGTGLDNIPGVKFDWTDASTHSLAFTHPQAQSSPITAAYLVPPADAMDVLPIMKPFIDTARSNGVRRFVLLSQADVDADGPYTGAVHKYLRDSGSEYTVLRATWFMENFSELQHQPTILHESAIYSATGTGKLVFVSADDIAAAAANALLRAESYNSDFIITGSEQWSYDNAAKLFSEVLGREVHHVKLSEGELRAAMVESGLVEDVAAMLAGLDAAIAAGQQLEITRDAEKLTGRKPVNLREFVEKNRQVWLK